MIYTSFWYFYTMHIMYYTGIFLFSFIIVFQPFQVIVSLYVVFNGLFVYTIIYQSHLFETQIDSNFASL